MLESNVRHRPAPVSAAVLLLLFFVACGDDDPSGPARPGDPASLSLSETTVHFAAIGATERLTASVTDANGIVLGDVSVSWSSADDAVVTVDGSGRVVAVGVGETEVTAAAGGASDRATVLVTQEAASVSVSPAVRELNAIGDAVQLSATVRDAGGVVIPDAVVAWSSADETVAAVDETGRVVAQANGTTTIEASAGDDVTDEAAVTVQQVVASVDVTPAVDTLAQGDVVQLAASAVDANGVEVAGAAVAWSSSDVAALTVDGGGTVTATGWGADVTITAAAQGVEGAAVRHVLGQIAFATSRDGGTYSIFMANSDGSDPVRLGNLSGASRPAWSPDGSKIAFMAGLEIHVMNVDGVGSTPLTDETAGDYEPDWSPDGTRIVFHTDRDGDLEIYAMGVAGTDLTNLSNNADSDQDPVWSPDGSMLAFTSARSGSNDVYIMDADGTNQVNLTNDPAADLAPAWSPDGSRIAFGSARDGDFEIYVMNADGTNPVRLTNAPGTDSEPSWSPDGSKIAFTSTRDGDQEIYVMNADGSDQTRITNNPGVDNWPAWRPRP